MNSPLSTLMLAGSLLGLAAPVALATAWGSIHNFDVVNDTGRPCHGFEIEIEDLVGREITYTYDWNHYGTPRIEEDVSNPLHPRVIVRYAATPLPGGGWSAFTDVPAGPIHPTDGHQFTNPSVNFGGEHFGVGYSGTPGAVSYFWLVDDGAGHLVRGPSVQIATPTFTFVAAPGEVPQVVAAIEPPPEPPVKEFGEASWVKEIRTETHNARPVPLRALVTDDPDDEHDRDWRNGEPDEVEVEWQLLQVDFRKADGGANGELVGAPEDLDRGDEVVTRRYEFFAYVGPVDEETGEAMADRVGPDGIHGSGIKEINGVEVDLATVEVVGAFLGAQMSAFDADAEVGLIEHVPDGVVGEPLVDRTVVVPGAEPFTATLEGELPPGLVFDAVAGVLSGTPETAGIYQYVIEARAGLDHVVRRTYTQSITASADDPVPVRVDTVAAPLDAGWTVGDGAYADGAEVLLLAVPRAGHVFAGWRENDAPVVGDAEHRLVAEVHHALVATFVEAPPLALRPAGDGLVLSWPVAGSEGWVLEEFVDSPTPGWIACPRAVTDLGGLHEVSLAGDLATARFRLRR